MDLQTIAKNYIGGAIAQKIGEKVGLPKQQVQSIITAILPLLLGGMAKNATSSKDGAESLVGALTKDHDGSIFENLDKLLEAPEQFKGTKILHHILGEKEGMMEQVIADQQDLAPEKVKGMMTVLAPLVMGAIGKEQNDGSLGLDDFMEMFNQQKAVQQNMQSPLLKMLEG